MTRPCVQCGHPLAAAETFCPQCDASTETAAAIRSDATADHEPPRVAVRSGVRDKRRDLALLGRVIADKYRVLELLGQGGFGSVFLVEITSGMVGQKLAMKVLPLDLTRDRKRREQFYQEIRIAMKMVHKYIVQIRDVGVTDDEIVYYTMDHVPGRTLAEILAAEKRLAPRRAMKIVLRTLRAVRAAHELGVIHCDLKPGNIMIQEQDGHETVRVLDFGIATAVDSEAKLRFQGSLYYAPPEQFLGREMGFYSDLYSVGVILYECLTGWKPYVGTSAREVYSSMKSGPPATVQEVAPDVAAAHPGLSRAVERALKRNPTKRFQSAVEFFEELAAVARGDRVALPSPRRARSVPARKASSKAAAVAKARPARHHRKRRTVARAGTNATRWIVPLILLLVVALALAWRLRDDEPSGSEEPPPLPSPTTDADPVSEALEIATIVHFLCDEAEVEDPPDVEKLATAAKRFRQAHAIGKEILLRRNITAEVKNRLLELDGTLEEEHTRILLGGRGHPSVDIPAAYEPLLPDR